MSSTSATTGYKIHEGSKSLLAQEKNLEILVFKKNIEYISLLYLQFLFILKYTTTHNWNFFLQ